MRQHKVHVERIVGGDCFEVLETASQRHDDVKVQLSVEDCRFVLYSLEFWPFELLEKVRSRRRNCIVNNDANDRRWQIGGFLLDNSANILASVQREFTCHLATG